MILMLLAALLGNGRGNAADAAGPPSFHRKRKGHHAEDAATDGAVKGP